MKNSFEAIVLGTGGVGSAALFHLAKRGVRALGIDRFAPGHDRGSSHGETRIIRQAYFEHANYVPLLLRAYELWTELELTTRQQLFHQVGLLQVGPASGQVVSGVLASAKQHGLRVEQYTAREIAVRFPGFRASDDLVGVLEPKAGYLRVEACVQAHANEAMALGAELITGETILTWKASGNNFVVTTDQNEYHTERLVITTGPWATELLSLLRLPLEVRRKHVYWLKPNDDRYSTQHGSPTFLYELPQGVFYGFPAIDSLGVKVAEHSGGVVVTDPLVDPRAFDPHDYQRVSEFLRSCLPGVSSQRTRHSVCFYTMTPDEHFIIDHWPGQTNLAFAAGLSGHGFKFTGVLGAALADLVLTGRTDLPIEFLGLARPGLQAC